MCAVARMFVPEADLLPQANFPPGSAATGQHYAGDERNRESGVSRRKGTVMITVRDSETDQENALELPA